VPPVRAIVTDVEGTTSAIAFVKDVLFPYADAHLDAYVAAHSAEPAVAEALRETARLAGEPAASESRIVSLLHTWMAEDRKATPLKMLQGLLWANGYTRGQLQGHVYADVVPVLRAWHAAGIRLYVYSSGSVVAQRVLFGHTNAGDLNPLFSGNFDTTTGAKQERASYETIAGEVGTAPGEILFLSDVEGELDAARAAGMQTARLLRPADTPPGAATTHPAYADFTALAGDLMRAAERA
jgi:enolase-phosphatase E1